MTIKDTKHWSDQSEAARDEVKDFVENIISWIVVRRKEVGIAASAVVAVAALASIIVYGRHARQNAAWEKLSEAEILAYSGRGDQADSLLADVGGEGSKDTPDAAAFANVLEGDLRFAHGQFDAALASYDKAATDSPETIRPYAQADRVITLESMGRFADCSSAAQSFIESHPDHILTAQVHAGLARCLLAQNQLDAARSALQKISLQYAGSPWTTWATDRLQALSAAAPK